MTDNTRLRIAMQKSGRLSDDSRELLARCGIKINLHTQRLIAMAENMPKSTMQREKPPEWWEKQKGSRVIRRGQRYRLVFNFRACT